MVIGVQDVPAKIVNESRNAGHDPLPVLTLNEEYDRFSSLGCHRRSYVGLTAVSLMSWDEPMLGNDVADEIVQRGISDFDLHELAGRGGPLVDIDNAVDFRR